MIGAGFPVLFLKSLRGGLLLTYRHVFIKVEEGRVVMQMVEMEENKKLTTLEVQELTYERRLQTIRLRRERHWKNLLKKQMILEDMPSQKLAEKDKKGPRPYGLDWLICWAFRMSSSHLLLPMVFLIPETSAGVLPSSAWCSRIRL